MKHILFFGVSIAAFMLVLPASGQDTPEKPKVNYEFLFKKWDANGDGKLSLEEFRKMTANWPRVQGKAEIADPRFKSLDTNNDGFLSLEEFRGLWKSTAAAKAKTPAKKPAETAKTPAKKPAETAKTFGPATADQLAFFEKKIRPVLVAQCYKCHAAESEKIRGELLLDTREGIRKGGESGPAVVPGDLKKSLLIKAIRHQDDLRMPKEKLSGDMIADFERWVVMGAPDPRDGKAKVVRQEIDIEKGRKFWAFQPPKKSDPPVVRDAAWPRTDVDRFLLAAREGKGLKAVADADPEALIRRVHFDLVGLPPTADDVEDFVKAYEKGGTSAQTAFESVVDKLLGSPRFGERWGRHWLDVARFAESTGKTANCSYPQAWRYRDYVIASFNADKPFDLFVREQLAGDLLPAKDDRTRADLLIATGFLAIGTKFTNEVVPLQFQMDVVDEQIDTTFQAFQGLSVGCARCHDHKFDPIPTRDYYALAGIFRSTETCYGTIKFGQSRYPSPLLPLPRGVKAPPWLEPLKASEKAALLKQIEKLTAEYKSKKTGLLAISDQINKAQFTLTQYEADGTPKLWAMGVREKAGPADSQVFIRGELDKIGAKVPRGVPQVLTRAQPEIKGGSGRRELADWLTSRDNPLTARVMVNRVWLHLFGRGIVATPDNFGASGQAPANQALLDSLAVSFMDNGWSVKKLIRSLVVSRAYQLASEHNAKNQDIDPDNAYVWHMSKRRLEGEALRDAMLAISGQLDLAPPVGSVMLKNGEGRVGLAAKSPQIAGDDRHRSVYLPIIRDGVPEMLALFDYPDPAIVSGARASTTIPAQALYLMNNPAVIKQAQATADRLLARPGSDDERIVLAYRTFLGRNPTTEEAFTASSFLKRYARRLTDDKVGPTEIRRESWATLTQALFASAEFSYVE